MNTVRTRPAQRHLITYKYHLDRNGGLDLERVGKTVVGDVPCLEYFKGVHNNRPLEFSLPTGVPMGAEPETVFVTYLDVGEAEPVEVGEVRFTEILELTGSFP